MSSAASSFELLVVVRMADAATEVVVSSAASSTHMVQLSFTAVSIGPTAGNTDAKLLNSGSTTTLKNPGYIHDKRMCA